MEDFFKHFRSFLGFPKFNGHNYQQDERDSNDSRYDAFADPSEMHRYFEQQMEKILRNFDIFQFGGTDPFFGEFGSNDGIEFFDHHVLPSIEDRQEGGELRDQFLKPGYERPANKHLERADRDLDQNSISIGDLDSVVAGNYFKKKEEQPGITTRFFGKSMSTKTVVNPDGSMEIHRTVRDNQGNEETTITRRIGDKEHTVTKKRDSTGKEEIIENLVNIDETDALLSVPEHKQPWSLYDKFFK